MAGKKFAEEINLAAEFFVGDGLEEFFGGGAGYRVELRDLCGRGMGNFAGFALGRKLRDEPDGLGAAE